jgi:protein-S-isoprenylcysteine O-methyltransferase Ste14
MTSIRSWIFVLVQFGCIISLSLTTPFMPANTLLFILAIFSVVIGVWSVWVMQSSKLNVFPDLRPGSLLITSGPYRMIRHPMYLAVLLFCIALSADRFTLFRLVMFLILLIDLISKMRYEEKLLSEQLPDFAEYCKKTWRLLPFVY